MKCILFKIIFCILLLFICMPFYSFADYSESDFLVSSSEFDDTMDYSIVKNMYNNYDYNDITHDLSDSYIHIVDDYSAIIKANVLDFNSDNFIDNYKSITIPNSVNGYDVKIASNFMSFKSNISYPNTILFIKSDNYKNNFVLKNAFDDFTDSYNNISDVIKINDNLIKSAKDSFKSGVLGVNFNNIASISLDNFVFANSDIKELTVPYLDYNIPNIMPYDDSILDYYNYYNFIWNTYSHGIDNQYKFGIGCFMNCDNLKKLILGSGNKTSFRSGPYEFYDCNILESVSINNNIDSIELSECTFKECKSLEDISFLNNLDYITIKEDCFYDTSVKSFSLSYNSLCAYDKVFGNCNNIVFVSLSGDTRLYDRVFYNCKNLQNIIINGDCKLNGDVFYNCKNLETIEINGNCELNGDVFYNCKNLETIEINGNCGFDGNVFYGCDNLKNIIINGDCIIKNSPFIETKSIENLIIKGYAKFYANSFVGLDSDFILNITNLCDFYDNAFSGSSLKNLSLSDDIYITRKAFSDSNIETVIMANNFTLMDNSFSDSTVLKNVKVGNNGVIETKSFGYCNSLENVIIGSNNKLSNEVFIDSGNLRDVTIGSNCVLSNKTFYGANGIVNINIDNPNDLNNLDFTGCSKLKYINNKPIIDVENGDLNFNLSIDIDTAKDIGFVNEYISYNADKVLDNIIIPGMNDMQKVKAIHDWVCDRFEYDYDNLNKSINNFDNTFMLSDLALCGGYAKAFNILAHNVGIETQLVYGVNHVWNVVCLNGMYFNIDTTWDDILSSNDNRSYDYFLISDNQIVDDTNHKDFRTEYTSGLHTFQDMKLHKCNYTIGDLSNDKKFSIADLVRMNEFLFGTLTYTSNLDIIADMNFDGEVNVFDLVIMRQKLLKQGSI